MQQLGLIQLTGCNQCSLKKEWPKLASPRMAITVPKYQSDVRIVIVGEAPGESEDREGEPFVGATGRLLRRCIPSGWSDKVWWTNTVRCRPPENRDPSLPELLCCSNYLQPDLLTIRPHAILAVGRIALDHFWPGSNISSHRGVPFPFQLDDGSWTWVMGLFHPSYVARGERKGRENAILPIFEGDLRRFFGRANEFLAPPNIPEPPKKDKIIIPNSLDEVKSLFNRLKPTPGVDFETFKLKPYQRDARMLTAAFSDDETTFGWPVNWKSTSPSWGMEAVRWCFNQRKRWVAHNASFELAWTWHNCDELDQQFDDSQGKPRILFGRKTMQSLADQTRVILGRDIKTLAGITTPGLEDYNFDVLDLTRYPIEDVIRYNALDAWASYELNKRYALSAEDRVNYERILASIKSTVSMELWGLDLNLNASAELKVSLAKKKDQYEKEAKSLLEVQRYIQDNKAFSLSAPDDIANVLVNYYGLRLPKTQGGQGKKYSTDEDDLKEFETSNELVRIVLDAREVNKLLSTYVEPILTGAQVGVDGLLHPSYSTMLTFTGRLSSQDPNIQNFPKRKNKEVRKQVKAPPGYVLCCIDYGQIEARGLVMASGDERLKQAFIDHEDIHMKWLMVCLKAYPDYMNRLASMSGMKEEKDIIKAGRTIIKTDFVFASFYGSIAKSVSDRTLIPLRIVEEILYDFWQEYAGVKNWIDGQFAFYLKNGYVETLTKMRRNELMDGNEPINTVIQGTCTGHIVLEAQNALWRRAFALGEYAGQKPDMNFMPRLNVHDDLSFYFPDDDRLEWYVDETSAEMVKPRFNFVNLPQMAESSVGFDWYDQIEVKKVEGQYFGRDGKLTGQVYMF